MRSVKCSIALKKNYLSLADGVVDDYGRVRPRQEGDVLNDQVTHVQCHVLLVANNLAYNNGSTRLCHCFCCDVKIVNI